MARLREFLPFINPLEAQWLSSRFANHFSIDRSLIEDNLSIKQEANLNSGLIVESQNQTKRPLRSRRRIRMKTTFRPRQEIKSLLPSGSEGL